MVWVMNVLLLSCHGVLEYDELRMWSEIPGLTIMSPGAYWEPHRGTDFRPPLSFTFPREWKEAWDRIPITPEQPDHKYHITEEAVEPFDVIVVMHHWPWIFDNWEVLKGKTVVWRDIGQTTPQEEVDLVKKVKDLGVKIVRYWDGYQSRKGYQGHDAIIPFGKYKEDFPVWQGSRQAVLGLCQSIEQRSEECRYECWNTSTQELSRVMLGGGNDGLPSWGGNKSYPELLHSLMTHRSMWYGGTRPAPYTLGLMEAMFTGIPIFTVRQPGWETAVTDLLRDYNLADSSTELRGKIAASLVTSRTLLGTVAQDQRRTAIECWDASVIKPKWEAFFKSL